jgi:hypothetical protein
LKTNNKQEEKGIVMRNFKHINRKFRVLRLLTVVQAYHYYMMMQMNHKLLKVDNNWQDAEHMSDWMNVLMPYRKSSPTDFMYDKNEVSDVVLDNYEEFKKWVKIAEQVLITEKTLTAFCKNVDNLQSVFHLKALGHVFYPNYLTAMYLYLENAISKTELQDSFVEYSLFTGKTKPANFALFRKTVLEIEKMILQIAAKQLERSVRSKLLQKPILI